MGWKPTQARIDIERRLSEGSPGEQITADEMEAICGLACGNSNYRGWRIVSQAIPKVERDYDLYWRWDRERKLWKCLTDPEKPVHIGKAVRSVHRKARRAKRMAVTVDYSAIDGPQRESVSRNMQLLHAMESLSDSSQQEKMPAPPNGQLLPSPDAIIASFRRLTQE